MRVEIPLSVRDDQVRWVVLWLPNDLLTEEEWQRLYEVILPLFKVGLVRADVDSAG